MLGNRVISHFHKSENADLFRGRTIGFSNGSFESLIAFFLYFCKGGECGGTRG